MIIIIEIKQLSDWWIATNHLEDIIKIAVLFVAIKMTLLWCFLDNSTSKHSVNMNVIPHTS